MPVESPNSLASCYPPSLWRHFLAITRLPRPSSREGALCAYIIEWANNHHYQIESQPVLASDSSRLQNVEPARNLRVFIPSSPGCELAAPVILQSHLDMVCEHDPLSPYDPEVGKIGLLVSEDWLTADGTTLGADNGIGIAAMLALGDAVSDHNLAEAVRHGPLILLFTADEEVGMTGAAALTIPFVLPNRLLKREFRRDAGGLLRGSPKTQPVLLNLDSEDDGVITIGSAGGCDTHILRRAVTQPLPVHFQAIELKLGGLCGGHSGMDIGTQKRTNSMHATSGNPLRGNAIKLLARTLDTISTIDSNLRLSTIQGGNAPNAIPRDCRAVILVDPGATESVVRIVNDAEVQLRSTHAEVDPNLYFSATPFPSIDGQVLTANETYELIVLLNALPSGPSRLSPHLSNVVETSSNLAVIKTEGSTVRITMSSRSFDEKQLDILLSRIHAAAKAAGVIDTDVRDTDRYPAWAPRFNSELTRLVQGVYRRHLGGAKPRLEIVHAGLECGMIAERIPGLEMVSFGPQIERAHSPGERVQISSVATFWRVLIDTIAELAVGERESIYVQYTMAAPVAGEVFRR